MANYNPETRRATYTFGNESVTLEFQNVTDEGVVNVGSDQPSDFVNTLCGQNGVLLGAPEGSFIPETMEAVFEAPTDNFSLILEYSPSNGVISFALPANFNGGLPNGHAITFRIRQKNNNNGGGQRPNVQINMSSTADVEWPGQPAVREDYFNYTGDDIITWNYANDHSWKYCSVSVNDLSDTARFDEGSPTKTISYTPTQGDADHVSVTFSFSWSFRPANEFVTINGTDYDIPLNFGNKGDWLDAFAFEYQNQSVYFTIPNVELRNSTINSDKVLDINIDLRPVNMAECYIGNFLWRSTPDENRPDDCIPHADLTLISAKYPADVEGGRSFDEATLLADSRLPKEQKTAKYITYGVDANGNGEMVLPAGTQVTMKIAPEFGYQVTAFKVNGQPIENANNASVSAGTDVAVFTFTIGYANFHLSADVLQVGNEARTDGAHEVTDAGVELSGSEPSMTMGTAKLEVEDAILADGQRELFEDAAEDGFEVTDVIDISLYNTVYKGSAASSWDTPVRTLSNPATIYLALEEDLSDKKVEIIHEKEIGSYEILETEYLEELDVIAFETTSFSNYAIAVMDDGPGKDANLVWYESGGKQYWYENGVRQGTVDDPKAVVFDGTVRGREIYDPASDSWYWLDADANGAIAKNKEVFVPYVYQEDKDWSDDDKRRISYESDNNVWDFIYGSMQGNMGKWIRYDENGKMVKGWFTIEGDVLSELYPDQVGNTYYYDNKTGAMVKGETVIDGVEYFFDPTTGVLKK